MLSGVPTIPQPHRAAGVPFFAGPENRLAQAASRHVLNSAADRPAYCPLVIYAPPSCGKTDLAHALGETWRKSNANHQVHVFAAADIRKQASVTAALMVTPSDKNSDMPASMFVVENLEQITKQPAAQHQLRRLIDVANSCGGRIVITSRVSPGSLDGLAPALRSRLDGGLVVPLARPSLATQSAIVAEDAKGENHLTSYDTSPAANVGEIAAVVAKYFRLKLADLKGRSRRRGTATARSLAMYLTWRGGEYSLKRIGQYFGGRDHSTVLHACRKIEQLIQHDAATRQTTAEINELLRGTTQTSRGKLVN